ncbi:MAG: hypothetical protein Ta2A_09490 [Treponemataceae bacterium]|nr:MAG: hypothetical protein Ta2A_09490 [Treponemataceae bacterium]
MKMILGDKMKKKLFWIAVFFAVTAFVALLAQARQSEPARRAKGAQKITVTGAVRLVGSAPFYDVVITDSAGKDWFIESSEQKQFEQFQQQKITVQASVEYIDMVLADGKFLGQRAIIKNVKLKSKPKSQK